MRYLFFVLLLVAFPTNLVADPLSLDEVMQATCKIVSYGPPNLFGGQSRYFGSGTVIAEDSDEYYIMTCGHIIGDLKNKIYAKFYHNGHISRGSAPLTIQWVRYNKGSSIDVAMLKVSKKYFSKIKPRVIPLADKGISLEVGNYIYGSGCPQGYWNQAWEGRIIRVSDNITYMNMAPLGGQSGSGVLSNLKDSDGNINTRLVGVVAWRFEDTRTGNREGGFVSIDRIHSIMEGKATTDKIKASYEMPILSNFNEKDLDNVCQNCGRKFKDHSITLDGKGDYVREKSGELEILCPTNRRWGSGIVIKNTLCPPLFGVCNNPNCPIHGIRRGNSPNSNITPPPPIFSEDEDQEDIWGLPEDDIKDDKEPEEDPNNDWVNSEEKNKLLEQIDELSNKIKLTEEEKKKLLDQNNEISNEKRGLLDSLGNINEKFKLTEKILGDKNKEYSDLLGSFTTTQEKNQELVEKNSDLKEDKIVTNVSFTAAGVAGTVGMWALKNYVGPAIFGSLRNRRKKRKKGDKNNPSEDDSGYNNIGDMNVGSIPQAVTNNSNDNSKDIGVVDKEADSDSSKSNVERRKGADQPKDDQKDNLWQMDPSELPKGKYPLEIEEDQLRNWNLYAQYYPQHYPIRGMSPGSPYGVPHFKKASGETIQAMLSEIANEYAADDTMTPGHIMDLLNQRLKQKGYS